MRAQGDNNGLMQPCTRSMSKLPPHAHKKKCGVSRSGTAETWFLIKVQTLQLRSGCCATVGFLSSILETQVMVRRKKKKKTAPQYIQRAEDVCFWFFTVNMSPRGVIMGAMLLCFLMGLLSPAQSACKFGVCFFCFLRSFFDLFCFVF